MFLELDIDLRAKTKTNTEIDVQCISFCVQERANNENGKKKNVVGIAVAFNRKRHHNWSLFIELLISKTLNRKPNITHTKMFISSTLTGSHLGFSHTQHLTSSTTNTITMWMSKTFQISNKNIEYCTQCTLQSSNIQKLITRTSCVISFDSVLGYFSCNFFRMNHSKALNSLRVQSKYKNQCGGFRLSCFV